MQVYGSLAVLSKENTGANLGERGQIWKQQINKAIIVKSYLNSTILENEYLQPYIIKVVYIRMTNTADVKQNMNITPTEIKN